jgi:hypothetical protein
MDSRTLLTLCATVAALVGVYFFTSLCGARKSVRRGGRSSAKVAKSTVLLAGPPGSGKTTLLHQLAFGRPVESVTGMREQVLHKQLRVHEARGDPVGPAAPRVTLVDYPGVGQLRTMLLRTAADSSAVVVVIDAAGGSGQIVLAAECVFRARRGLLAFGVLLSMR